MANNEKLGLSEEKLELTGEWEEKGRDTYTKNMHLLIFIVFLEQNYDK